MNIKQRWFLVATLLLLGPLWVGNAQDTTDREPAVVVSNRTKQLLTEALATDDPSLRSRALHALTRIAEPSTANAVRALLTQNEPAIRVEALATLEAILPTAEFIDLARGACADPSETVARHAFVALARVTGDDAYAALVSARQGLTGERTVWWARAVARRPEQPAPEVLDAMLGDADPRIRTAAAKLVALHPDAIDVARRVELLADTDVVVRAAAAQSLGKTAAEGPPRAALLARLDDRSPLVRRAALEALSEASPPQQRIEPLLQDKDATVRLAAVDAVAAGGGDDTVALLVGRLSDPEVLVARRAGRRLAQRGGEDVARALQTMLDGDNDQATAEAARALGLMNHTASVQRLIALAGHRAQEVRIAVYDALGQLGDTTAVPVLIARGDKETGDAHVAARVALNEALGRLGDSRALPHLFIEIHYPDPSSMGIDPANFTGGGAPHPPPYKKEDTAVAASAVRALGQIGDPKALPELMRVAKDVLRNEQFWENFVWSLEQLGEPDQVSGALEQIGIVGAIAQSARRYDFSDSTRAAALRAIAHLQLRDLAPRIFNIDPRGCSTEVRRAAAEALTALTGERHAYRRPVETTELFFYDIGKLEDEDLLRLPICYVVDQL